MDQVYLRYLTIAKDKTIPQDTYRRATPPPLTPKS